MTATFPPLTPDRGLTITQPRHPYVARRSSGGGESRIRLSNVMVAAKINFTFGNIETEQLLGLVNHWRDARGTARDFQIRSENLGAMATAGQALLLSITWKYAGPPKCIDICGGVPGRLLHTIELELISQPQRVAANIDPLVPDLPMPVPPSSIRGGAIAVRTVIVGGLINVDGGISLRGATLTTGQVWVSGGRFSTVLNELPGVDITATAGMSGGVYSLSAPDPAVIGAGASVAGGVFTLFGAMPGGTLSAAATVTGGVLSIPARAIGGASITAQVALNPGHYDQIAPGGALSAAGQVVGGQLSIEQNGAQISGQAAISGGQFSSEQNGGVLTASAVIAGGSFNSTVSFASVALLIPGDGSNNSINILDVSSNALTITRSGSPVISTSAHKFGGASVKIAQATQDRLTVDSGLLNPGNTDFWCEAWMRWTGTSGANFQIYLAHEQNFDGDSNNRLLFSRNNASGQLTASIKLRVNTTFYGVTGSLANSLTTTFYHIAWGRVNGELAVWLDGVLSQTTLSGTSGKSIGTATVSTRGNKMFFGPRAVETGWQNYPDVFMDDFRYVKTTPPWGLNNFNPPTSAHPTS